MKKEVVILGSRDKTIGYRIAGARTVDVEDREELEETLQKDPILLVTSEAAEKLGERLAELKSEHMLQVIPGQGYDSLKNLVKDTIGFEPKR